MATHATKKFNLRTRKSAAIALGVIGIAGLSLASAATLNIDTGSLGAGTKVIASCDDAIAAGFTNTYSGSAKLYQTDGVALSGIADVCKGLSYKVELYGASGALGEATGTLPGTWATGTADARTFTASVTAVDASTVTGVAIVIYS